MRRVSLERDRPGQGCARAPARGAVPTGAGGSPGTYDSYSGRLSLNQNIYAFGKYSTRVEVQQLNLDASTYDLETVIQQVAYNVKESYYGLLQAQRNRDIADESVRQYELRLEQARGFFEFGTRSKYDVTKAEVDLSNARLDQITAQNAIKTAVSKLNNAMGLDEEPSYKIKDTLSFEKYDVTAEEAMTRAMENRPDLKSLATEIRAAESSVELSRKNYYPVASGTAAYTWNGTMFPLDPSWNVGMSVSVPIFTGLNTRKQVEEAKADLEVAKSKEESLRKDVSLEVQQAYVSLIEAEEKIPVADLTVQQAQENLDIANGRYAEGVGSIIEVTDAQAAYTSAKTASIEALYDYRIAIANLEKAMGIR